jgi:tripartite-type tricarboxylate transporter receptor subunit TctC
MVATPAAADDYPSRPIRIIASQGAGGLSDIWMRAVADQMGPVLGNSASVVIEDRTGAGGTIGARACGEAQPDGYTFCILPVEAVAINPIINPVSGWDPAKSLAPVTKAFYLTQVFGVNASLGAKNFKELIALAKAKPKTLSYMAPSISKVAFMEDLNKKNGIDFVRVPFKGGGDAVNGVLTGATPITFLGVGNLISYLQSGMMTGLVIDGAQRSPLFPDIPTLRETGYRGPLTRSYFALYAPMGTPPAVIAKIAAEVRQIAGADMFREKNLTARGLEPVFNTPEEFAQFLKQDRIEAQRVVKDAGLLPQ